MWRCMRQQPMICSFWLTFQDECGTNYLRHSCTACCLGPTRQLLKPFDKTVLFFWFEHASLSSIPGLIPCCESYFLSSCFGAVKIPSGSSAFGKCQVQKINTVVKPSISHAQYDHFNGWCKLNHPQSWEVYVITGSCTLYTLLRKPPQSNHYIYITEFTTWLLHSTRFLFLASGLLFV